MKRKLFAILACAALFGATASLALADHQIGGYYRVQGIMEYYSLAKDAQPDSYVDQRLRMKWVNTLNEYVAVTWFGEVDTTWGETSKGNIGNGGKAGADGVNVETKNAYLDLKLPNTPVSARIGVQGLGDMGLQSLFFNDDLAAAAFMVGVGPVNVTALWAKFDEGSQQILKEDTPLTVVWIDDNNDGVADPTEFYAEPVATSDRDSEDDTDLYGVQAGFAATDTLKFGAELYWLNVNGSGVEAATADLYTLGVSADMKFGPVGVDAFVAAQSGEAGNTDIAALAASANASMKAGPADLALRLIYMGNDDDAEDEMSFQGGQGVLEFYKEGQTIFLTDIWKCNNSSSADRRALTDAGYAGYGLFAAIAKAGATFGPFAVKGSVGYYMALDDSRDDEAVASREGTNLGTEIDAEVSMKVADAATLSLRGAYALLGDFYDNSAAGGEDPDDLYKLALMVNVPY